MLFDSDMTLVILLDFSAHTIIAIKQVLTAHSAGSSAGLWKQAELTASPPLSFGRSHHAF